MTIKYRHAAAFLKGQFIRSTAAAERRLDVSGLFLYFIAKHPRTVWAVIQQYVADRGPVSAADTISARVILDAGTDAFFMEIMNGATQTHLPGLPRAAKRAAMQSRTWARAFAPANISLVFETYDAEPPHERGSLGVGITLVEGVTVKAAAKADGETEIVVRGEAWDFPTVRQVARELAPQGVRLEIEAAWPFGCGFGMSGASALAAALAMDELFQLGREREELGMIAHRAEVANSTGLGDVGGQFNGGIMIKTWKHHPLTVRQLPVQPQTLHWKIYGPIATAEVITSRDMLRAISRAGHEALEIIAAAPELDMARLFEISRDFARGSGLIRQRVERSIAEAEAAGHRASMIMLGEAVIATGPFPGSRPVEITFEGARVINHG